MKQKEKGISKKKRGLFSKLSLLNPKNLEREVHVYGYNFSWKAHVLVVSGSLMGIGAIALLFKLKPFFISISLAAVVIILPIFILSSYQRMYQQKRFADATTYMEQMLYSFQKNKKIMDSLRETRDVFDEGQMRDVLEQALMHLSNGYATTEQGVFRESLELVENSYKCDKIRTVHELLVGSEEYGGNEDKSITLLLADLEGWKRRGYKLQAQKKTSHTDNIISIIAATTLSAVALYVMDGMRNLYPQAGANMISIFEMPVIQVSSLIFLLFMLYVLTKSQKMLATDWLQTVELHDDDYLLGSYDAVVNYDEVGQKRKSLLYAAPFIISGVAALVFGNLWVGVILLIISTFMLSQHRVGYNLAQKDINEELYVEFPQWLMNIALLLQSNNVQVSISKSVASAPIIIRKELSLLLERLANEPDSLKAYTDFCSKFDIPEAKSCMRMLHSISEAGTGDAEMQINNLLLRVNEMQEQADIIRDSNIAFKARMIFSYPVLGATFKLLIDLTLGMFYMMGMLSNMGGV